MIERSSRALGERAVEHAHYLYAAGVLALTEPGPGAAGVVITDAEGRALAHRAHYVGTSTRRQAAAEALLSALRLAESNGISEPIFRVDDPALAEALTEGGASLPADVASLTPLLREIAARLPSRRVEVVSPAANPARTVALAPLVDWLPERARKSEDLRVRQLGEHEFEVESASQPGQKYRVDLRRAGNEGDGLGCECADFEYRGIPCKHVLAAARHAGVLERLFYPG